MTRNVREVVPVAARVSGQQRQAPNGGMGADEEVRQHAVPGAAPSPVPKVGARRQEQGRPGRPLQLQSGSAQEGFGLFHLFEGAETSA
jgi:hypothetical protein